MKKNNDAELKQIIAALKNRPLPNPSTVDIVEPAQRALLRKALGKELDPILGSAGLNIRRVDEVLKKYQASLLRANEEGKLRVAKTFARTDKAIRQGISARLKALKQVSNVLNLGGIPMTILAPFLIWTKPLEIMVDSQIVPGSSWAKIKAVSNSTSNHRLSFYFYWDNPSDGVAVINVASSLVPKGMCDAVANTGILSGGSVSMYINAVLQTFGWEVVGNQNSGSVIQNIASLSAHGSGFWSMETGDVDSTGIFDTFDLERDFFLVPPGTRAIFEIAMTIDSYIDDGYTSYDFANDTANFQVTCPFIVVTLLSAPPVVAAQA